VRPVYDTTSPSTVSAPVQLFSGDSGANLFSITVKARASNAVNMYFGFDSGVASTNGYELQPNESITLTAAEVRTLKSATIRAKSLWATAASTTAFIDWLMLLED